jgi:acyl-CoA reductase-like NAD-dependent aldehyde dehydrogenase
MITKQGADILKRTHFELGGTNPVICLKMQTLSAP